MRKNMKYHINVVAKTAISFLACLLISFNGYAQEIKRISIDEKQITIKELIKLIEQKSDYAFAYAQDAFDINATVNVDAQNKPANEIISAAIPNVEVKVDNKTIIILKREAPQSSSAHNVTGIVYNDQKEPLIGVSVVNESTGRGVITSSYGEYEIEVDGDCNLQFSYIGYDPISIAVGARSNIDVTFTTSSIDIDPVVAVGYGVQKRSSVTGAIASIKAEDVSKTAITSVSNMLSGQVSGVQVTQSSAQPGAAISVVIRGAGSVNASNEPLYVIDGFPVSNESVEPGSGDRYSMGDRSPLNSINPNDIESIEILKDASATAIYGARAANGVVLITTKRGQDGKTKVEASYSHSFQKMDSYFDVLNAKEFMEMSNYLGKEYYRIQNNIYPYGSGDESLMSGYTNSYTEAQIAAAGEGTNWFNEVTRPGSIDDLNVSLSGGNAKTKFLISSNYYNQTGVVYNSDFMRVTGRVNLDHTINKMVKVGVNITGSYIENGNTQLGDGEWENSGVLVSALAFNPLISVYDAYGEYSVDSNNGTLPNPVSYREIDDTTAQKRVLTNAYIEVNPIKDLTARVNVGIDNNSATRRNYMPVDFLYGSQYDGKAYCSYTDKVDLLFNAVVNYSKEINNTHTISAMAGYEFQKFNSSGFSASNNDFFTDAFGANDLSAGSGTPSVDSWKSTDLIASYFARLNYTYKDRYVFNVTVRRDGTSNFGENNKWGVFPSAAISWRINNEEFMKSIEALNNLKLRVSYGATGNSSIGDGAYSYYGTEGSVIIGGNKATSVTMTQLGNPNLRWETTTEFDIGLDFGFWNNRVYGTLEYYNKIVSDILMWNDLPTYSNVSTMADNVGSTQLSGFEFNIGARVSDRAFKWTIDLNGATYKNRWKERSPDVILAPYEGDGDPINAIYAYKMIGVAQIGQEVEYMPNILPGNQIYENVNGDDTIDDSDIQLIGSSDPGFSYGINNTFEYKRFDLGVFMYGFGDYRITNPNKYKYEMDAYRLPLTGLNMMTTVADIWTAENPSTEKPGMASNAYGSSSDYLVEKANFLRLKSITLGYSLPQTLLRGADVRLYFDAQNVCVFTNYTGVDPETDGLGGYPNVQSYSLGVNVKF